jgi:formyltetrahydrofolate hydrolase
VFAATHCRAARSSPTFTRSIHGGAFFQRTVFSAGELKVILPEIEKDLVKQTENGFELQFRLRDMSVPKRVAIFASKSDHGNHTIVFA